MARDDFLQKNNKKSFLEYKEGHENGKNTMENVVKYNITFRVFYIICLVIVCCCWTYSEFCATH